MRCALFLLLLLFASCSEHTPEVSANRPNVVLLLVDDLGWNDVSYHGGEIRTPSIDRLAEEGLRLERFYMMPQCTLSRASLLTGKLPMRLGVMKNLRPADEWGLPTDERTLADSLRDAGYETALVGKWHLGHAQREMRPLARGFDSFYGHLHGYLCLLYTSPSPRDQRGSRMPSSA